jgi:hypothetical protein
VVRALLAVATPLGDRGFRSRFRQPIAYPRRTDWEQMLDTHVYLSTGRADPMQSGGFRSTKYARLETTRRLACSLGDIVRANGEVRILGCRPLVLRAILPASCSGTQRRADAAFLS